MLSRIFTVIFLLGISPLVVQSQTLSEFSENKNDFLKELDNFLNANKQEKTKIIYEQFEQHLTSGAFDADQFAKIREFGNIMLSKKLKGYPYFNNYFTSLNSMAKAGKVGKDFDSYFSVLENIFKNLKTGRYTPFKNYMAFASDLFLSNALYVSSSNSSWRLTKDNYKLTYKDKKPIVEFPEAELIGKRKEDSIIITKTTGTFYPLENVWKGDKGEVSWERIGMKDVYAQFGTYTIEVKKNGFAVDSSVLYYPQFMDKPIVGNFSDKIVVGNQAIGNTYPRFLSKEKRIKIDDLGEGIDYYGGFALEGENFIGKGDAENKAIIEFKDKSGKLAVRAASESFLIRKGERIVSKEAQVSVYFGQDSIFHPKTNFKFEIPKREMTIARGDQGSSKTPFTNTHHNFDIIVESINWQIDSDSIEIGRPRLTGAKRKVGFESLNFYDEVKFVKFQNIATYNPAVIIKVYCEELSKEAGEEIRVLDANDLAKRLNPRYSLSTIMSLINSLVEEGFAYYDGEKQELTVKQKLFNWVDANAERADYDIIKFQSKGIKETNALLRLSDNKMDIRGVSSIAISDSQKVKIFPYGEKVVVGENRNINWEGQVLGGYGIFTGRNFDFDYNSFGMSLDSLDSFVIQVPEGENPDGSPILKPIYTQIENTSGYLQIDAPGNKSGKDNLPEFPSFESKRNSYAYYSSPDIQGNAYSRDEFFFEIEPFTFDSLDSFDPSAIGFSGKLNSGGIFPDLEEELKIQPGDRSLGFVTQTPPGGLDVYKGKGNYTSEISLNNSGLTGKGTVDYLTSSMDSDDIVFLPQKMKATAKDFSIEKKEGGVEYPEVNAKDVSVDWTPYKDSMYIKSKDDPFKFFNNEKELNGDLALTPGGLYGSGDLSWDQATMKSKELKFKAFGVSSDTCNIEINALDSDKVAFNSSNMKADLDFKTQKGTLEANNAENIPTNLPHNQYYTTLDYFIWDMKEEMMNITSKSGAIGKFVSTAKGQDSLSFSASNALFDMKTHTLSVEGVQFIEVADAIVYPDEGKLTIQAGAAMERLKNAKIVANTTNKYHNINRAEVSIKGKNSYAGKGYYQYNVGTKEQEIYMDNIYVSEKPKDNFVTKSSGKIKQGEKFYIDNQIMFKGDVKLEANAKNLNFNGFAKLESKRLKNPPWFSTKSLIDRNKVIVKYKKPKTPDGGHLRVGLAFNQDTVALYNRVMERPIKAMDQRVFNAEGIVYHDKKRQQFLFGDSLKIFGADIKKGNKLVFNENSGKIEMEGIFDFDSGFKENLIFDIAGTASAQHRTYDTQFKVIAGLDVPLPEKCLLALADDLIANSESLPDVENFDPWVEKALAELIDQPKQLEKVLQKMKTNLEIDLPKESTYKFFLSKLPFKWNEETLSFTSLGSTGVGSIGGKTINKVVRCYIEILNLPTGDVFTMYLESPSEMWYYINYDNGVLKTISSNEAYNEVLLSMKKKDAFVKMPSGQTIEITIDNVNAVNFFRSRMRT